MNKNKSTPKTAIATNAKKREPSGITKLGRIHMAINMPKFLCMIQKNGNHCPFQAKDIEVIFKHQERVHKAKVNREMVENVGMMG